MVWIENFDEVIAEATQGVVQAHRVGPIRNSVEKKLVFDIEIEREVLRNARGEGVINQSGEVTISNEVESTSKGRDSEPEGGSTSKGQDRIGDTADVRRKNQFVVLSEESAEQTDTMTRKPVNKKKEEAYPYYANPAKKRKEYYSAARCEHPEWREKIAWVLRYVMGRVEGRELSKGVLAAMLESAETGVGVNWAYIITERLRTEFRKLKLARKDNPVNKPTPKATEKKKKEEPLRTLVKPSGKKLVTPAKNAKKTKADTKKVEESPSQRTRAAKRKLANDSQDGRRNRRLESQRRMRKEVTPPYRQPTPQSIPSEDSVEKKERVRNFGGKLLDTVTTSSEETTGGPPGFAPLLRALGESGELKRAEHIQDVCLPTDSSSDPDHNKRKFRRRGEEAEIVVMKARKPAQGSGRLKKWLKQGEKLQKTLLADPARHANAQTPETVNDEAARKKINPVEAIAKAINLIPSRPVNVFKDDQSDLRVKSVVNNALEKAMEEKVSANIPLHSGF
ncbi:hypothetical protein R1sor_000840 [Riccia sorocarpa]|uniref:Uncharacterized protein n=1 Tax=Riccia sorocarpa TaxID=122646 RepID=A0ABD3GUB7_9MARC